MRHKLLKSTSMVALMTLLSRVFGFARDMVSAQIFGAGGDFDAFVVAFKLPNFLRRLFGEGAFAQAFVPVLAEYRENSDEEQTRLFIGRIMGTLSIIVTIVVALSEIFAPVIIVVFAPGFLHDPARFELATRMLRIIFPYLLMISLVAFAGAALNTYQRFAIPAFTPVVLNSALIIVSYWWAPHTAQPIYTLAWGVIIGGIVQIALQIPFLYKEKLLALPRMGFMDPGVKRVLKLMVPALFGVSVAQVSLMIDNFFASFLPAGSISWLYYSDRLTYLPLGVIGVALATVVMPHLSRQHAVRATEHFSRTLDWALRSALLIGVPCAFGLLVLSGPILVTLMQHGAFTLNDVMMTRRSLMAFSLGLPAFMLIKILASAFYSRQEIRTPVKIAAFTMLVNLVLNVLLVFPLKHAGLALASALAAFVNSGMLAYLLLRRGIFKPQAGWGPYLVRLISANIAMILVLLWVHGSLLDWQKWSLLVRIGHLCGAIALGVIVYLVFLFLTGMRRCHIRPPAL